MKRERFESALEVTARVIGNNFGVTVEFEGEEAFTDGKRIRLPHFQALDDDQQQALNGYLDHEVGHILFTDFDAWNEIRQDFHRSLTNFAEDVRIEREMAERFAGAGRHLESLRARMEAEQDAKWSECQLLFRFCGAVQRILLEHSYPNDPEVEPFLCACAEEIEALSAARSTGEVIEFTARIIEKLKHLLDQPEPPAMPATTGMPQAGTGGDANSPTPSSEGAAGTAQAGTGEDPELAGPSSDGGKSETGEPCNPVSGDNSPSGAPGEGVPPAAPGMPQANESETAGSGPESPSGGGPGAASAQPANSSKQANPDQGAEGETNPSGDSGGQPARPDQAGPDQAGPDQPGEGLPGSWGTLRSEAREVLENPDAHAAAEKAFGGDLGKRLLEAIHEWIAREAEEADGPPPSEGEARRVISDGQVLRKPFFPATRRFDREVRVAGNRSHYQRLVQATRAARTKLRVELERSLFAEEPSRYVLDLEEGELDPGALYGVRTGRLDVFREFRPGRVFNTAVSLLVDCSGSMSQAMPAQKLALCAVGESLLGLNVPFEITGFRSDRDHRMEQYRQTLSHPERFNRTRSRVDYLLAKEFRDRKLTGITGLEADGGTPLNEAVQWAGRRLDRQPEARKVLIVFTDGEPCGCGDDRVLRNDLLLQIHRLEAIGIEVIGFAINCPSVGRFFSRVINITNISDLEGSSLREIRRVLDPSASRHPKRTA